MKLRRILLNLTLLFITALQVHAVHAHHSFAMFDKDIDTTMTGVINKFAWKNPHVFVIVDSKNEQGENVRYTLEASSPNLLSHSGWNRKTLEKGQKVSFMFHPLKNGKPGGMLMTITLPSGKVMNAW